MKKAINLIIAAVLVFSLLTACTINDVPSNGTINSSGNTANTTNKKQIDTRKISNILDFSNGLAFLKYKDDNTIYCIDKTGKQIFTLENCFLILGSGYYEFNEKVALIETLQEEIMLCDRNGKIYKAEDFNAARIVDDERVFLQAFLDGYIILERREESFTGTKIEMSIMDSDFTTLVPFSVELAEILNSDIWGYAGDQYWDGYLYKYDYIVDLRTGTKSSDRTKISTNNPELEYRAVGTSGGKFNHLQAGDIYNNINGEVIGKVEDHENISCISFAKGLGLAEYHTDNGTWFNIITQDGNAKFQPIKAGESVKFDGETILAANKYTIENKRTPGIELKTYDIQGNLLGEIVLEDLSTAYGTVTLSDGVIQIHNYDTGEYLFLDSSLKKLF